MIWAMRHATDGSFVGGAVEKPAGVVWLLHCVLLKVCVNASPRFVGEGGGQRFASVLVAGVHYLGNEQIATSDGVGVGSTGSYTARGIKHPIN